MGIKLNIDEATFRGGGIVQLQKASKGGTVRLEFSFETIEFAEMARDLLQEVADVGEKAAKRRVPVDTGALQASIKGVVRRRKDKIAAVVEAGGPEAPHWSFVEYGTGLRGQSVSSDEVEGTRDVPIGWRYDHKGRKWQGMAPRPYLRPAIDDMRAFMRSR